jgi:hypothetical protein
MCFNEEDSDMGLISVNAEIRNTCKSFVSKPPAKRPLSRPRPRIMNATERYLKEIRCEDTNWLTTVKNFRLL